MEETKKTPDTCYQLNPIDNIPIIIKFGETGYHETTYTNPWNQKTINKMNKNLGVSLAQAEAMITCSMSGNWDNFQEMVKSIEARKKV